MCYLWNQPATWWIPCPPHSFLSLTFYLERILYVAIILSEYILFNAANLFGEAKHASLFHKLLSMHFLYFHQVKTQFHHIDSNNSCQHGLFQFFKLKVINTYTGDHIVLLIQRWSQHCYIAVLLLFIVYTVTQCLKNGYSIITFAVLCIV